MLIKRRELKFITYFIYYDEIVNWIKKNKYNFKKQYNDRLVNNIYFDSYSYDSFKENIFGSSEKTKVRYRWYEKFDESNYGSLEIKKRKNIFGFKEIFNIKNLQITKESDLKKIYDFIKNQLDLKKKLYLTARPYPTIINQYSREYYIDFNENFRITIDKKIKIYDQRLNSKINIKNKIYTPDFMVVEFKFNQNFNDEIIDICKNFPLRVSRNSKYVNAIRASAGI
jgi:hypothetical protein